MRNISSKSMHAFLSKLANRQTNTGKTCTSFVGGRYTSDCRQYLIAGFCQVHVSAICHTFRHRHNELMINGAVALCIASHNNATSTSLPTHTTVAVAPRCNRLSRPDPKTGRYTDNKRHEIFDHEHINVWPGCFDTIEIRWQTSNRMILVQAHGSEP